MKKEESNLKMKYGTKEPFQVPEGYFEQFTARMMEQLPEHKITQADMQEPTRWQRLRPMLYMAAMFCLLLCAGKLLQTYTWQPEKTTTAEASQDSSKTEDATYMDEMVNYAMIDQSVLYNYMIESE